MAMYISRYASPLGEITFTADDSGLTGCFFTDQKYFGGRYGDTIVSAGNAVHPYLTDAVRYMDAYFSKKQLPEPPPLHLTAMGTPFQCLVWNCLLTIPYGTVTTYGEIAGTVAVRLRQNHMAAQAVGNAIGHNPISILIPCHRVVGKDHKMLGYAGGIWRKQALLQLEGVEL